MTPSAPTVNVPVAVEQAKPWHKSLTVMLNGIVALGATAFTTALALDPTSVNLIVSQIVPNREIAMQVAGLAVSILGLANVIIRVYKTKQPIQ